MAALFAVFHVGLYAFDLRRGRIFDVDSAGNKTPRRWPPQSIEEFRNGIPKVFVSKKQWS